MKDTLIKWTIIIIIAACALYLVYPKYSFHFPTGPGTRILYKANKITGIVKVYIYSWGQGVDISKSSNSAQPDDEWEKVDLNNYGKTEKKEKGQWHEY